MKWQRQQLAFKAIGVRALKPINMSRTRRTMRVALILAACIATGSGQGLPLPHRPAFPFLPKPGANAAALQALAPGYADAAGMAPSMEEVQVWQAHEVCQNLTN